MKFTYEDTLYDIDEELSFRDFTGWDFNDRPEYDFTGKTIYASCFSHEMVDKEIFNPSTKGATFIKCNLANVFIPKDNIVIDCQTQRFQMQNDLEDWVVDAVTKEPVEPVLKKIFEKLDISTDPADIPATKQAEGAIYKKQKEEASK